MSEIPLSTNATNLKAMDILRTEEQFIGRPSQLLRATRSTVVVEGQTHEVWFIVYRIEYETYDFTETRWAVYEDGKPLAGGVIR